MKNTLLESESSTDLSVSLDVSASSADEFDEVIFIDVQSDKLSASIDDVNTISLGVSGTDEDGVVGDLSLADDGSRGDFNDEEMAELGHDV